MADSLRTLLRSLPTPGSARLPMDPAHRPADPVELFAEWITAAIDGGCAVPHAATLATAGPDARTLILKDVSDDGFWFATRTDGRKAAQLTADPHATMVFFWGEQARQVRVHGVVTFGSDEESDADFRARPAHSRATTMLGTQSAPMPEDVDYPETFAAAVALAAAEPDAGSANWRTAVLRPERVEFWSTTATDGQLRLEYVRDEDGWTSRRLWP